MANTFPKLIAFDLDYTLWPLWIDTHAVGPLRREGDSINEILDRDGEAISFYPQVPDILHRLPASGVTVATCSRTETPRLARKALALLLLSPSGADASHEPTPAIEYFDQMEIYPGSKLKHFKELYKKTGIPYADMLFFDDEQRNIEVASLGVTFCLVENGVDERTFEKGVALWRARNPVEED